MINRHWRIYRGELRPGMIHTQIMEIQTKAGETVIPWGGFDSLRLPMYKKLEIARNIVRTHNEDLNRRNNGNLN